MSQVGPIGVTPSPRPCRRLHHHGHVLAVDEGRAVEVRAERVRVRDVVRVERRAQAEGDDHGEERRHRERDAIPEQAAAGQLPRAGRDDGEVPARGGEDLVDDRAAHRAPRCAATAPRTGRPASRTAC